METVNLNGHLLNPANIGIDQVTRAYRFGDALFETMRVVEGKIQFWKLHWRRLKMGSTLLEYDLGQSKRFYRNEILKLCRREGCWRVRLTIFRKGGGLYTPRTHATGFLIEASPLPNAQLSWKKKGLKIDICDTIHLPAHTFFNHKTANSLFYVIASRYKQQKHLDDCLLLNDRKQLVEACSSNLILIRKNKLYTPPLRSGCKDGIMRRIVLQQAGSLGLEVIEKSLKEKHLFAADELWLTNSIQSIRWVGQFREQFYQGKIAKKMIKLINKL